MSIKLKGSTDGSVTLQAPADTSPTGTDKTLTLPTTEGSANQFIKNGSTPGTLEHSSMVEDSSGQVGIGTSSPTSGLHLKEEQPTITLQPTADTEACLINFRNAADSNTRGFVKYDLTDDSMSFRTNGAGEQMRIDSSGNVGIGTSTPGRALEVNSGTTDVVINAVSTDGGSFISFEDDSTTGDTYVRLGAIGDDLRLDAGNNERMRIDSSGFVGIGTSNPACELHVEDTSGSCGIRCISNTSGTSFLHLGDTSDNDVGSIQYNNSSNFMSFITNNSERTRIDSSGRMLLGRTSYADSNSLIEAYKSSGNIRIRVDSASLGNGEYSMFRARGNSREAFVGVYKHSGITNPAGFLMLEAQDGANGYMWISDGNRLRGSTTVTHIGTTNGTVMSNSLSDARLKNIGADVTYGLAEIKQLQPKHYSYKKEDHIPLIGFIAQEVESIVPEAVYDTHEELEGHQEGDRTKLAMDYEQLIPVLVNAVKELSAEIDTLKAKVAALEAVE